MKFRYGLIYVVASLVAPAAMSAATASLQFEGSDREVIRVAAENATGLDAIYVAWSVDNITASYQTQGGDAPKWYRYSTLGGGYAEEVTDVTYSSGISTLRNVEGDMGYIVEDGDRRYYFWITDYSKHLCELRGLTTATEMQCDYTTLLLEGEAGPIHFYGINGRRYDLSRDLKLNYQNLEWEEANELYAQTEQTDNLSSVTESIVLSTPVYCRTYFTLSGDRFQQEWGIGHNITSDMFEPTATAVESKAETVTEPVDEGHVSNRIPNQGNDLGGSAPAEINFIAFTTDAVIHDEWQISRNQDFDPVEYRFNEKDLNYTFRDEGTVYVRFVGSNADGSCVSYGETYTVTIGASQIKCPNAFSPGSSEGVNDEWRVSYTSLLDFECWIFDRYGNQLFHTTNPEAGWDGRYRGKLVKPGVYYYVIRARGADNKEYKLSGDINILRRRSATGGSTSPDTPVE